MDGVLGPVRDDDLAHLGRQSMVPRIMVGHGLTQLGDAGGWRVVGFSRPDRLQGGFLDVHRRIEIGFSQGEVEDLQALGLQPLRLGSHGQRRRWLDQSRPFCKLQRHASPFFILSLTDRSGSRPIPAEVSRLSPCRKPASPRSATVRLGSRSVGRSCQVRCSQADSILPIPLFLQRDLHVPSGMISYAGRAIRDDRPSAGY